MSVKNCTLKVHILWGAWQSVHRRIAHSHYGVVFYSCLCVLSMNSRYSYLWIHQYHEDFCWFQSNQWHLINFLRSKNMFESLIFGILCFFFRYSTRFFPLIPHRAHCYSVWADETLISPRMLQRRRGGLFFFRVCWAAMEWQKSCCFSGAVRHFRQTAMQPLP